MNPEIPEEDVELLIEEVKTLRQECSQEQRRKKLNEREKREMEARVKELKKIYGEPGKVLGVFYLEDEEEKERIARETMSDKKKFIEMSTLTGASKPMGTY
jgi:vacuolar-type H+-ATPase subunit I/STV1